jgi:hypothetical protein
MLCSMCCALLSVLCSALCFVLCSVCCALLSVLCIAQCVMLCAVCYALLSVIIQYRYWDFSFKIEEYAIVSVHGSSSSYITMPPIASKCSLIFIRCELSLAYTVQYALSFIYALSRSPASIFFTMHSPRSVLHVFQLFSNTIKLMPITLKYS